MSDLIGDLENELGAIISEIESLEDQLGTLEERRIRVATELLQAEEE